ncbi:MAG: hypothetical protein AAGB13_05075 [Cyanobacteria bacterium P01_F01_bin.33]
MVSGTDSTAYMPSGAVVNAKPDARGSDRCVSRFDVTNRSFPKFGNERALQLDVRRTPVKAPGSSSIKRTQLLVPRG